MAVPADTPVTIPVEPTFTLPVPLLLLQVPPAVISLNVVVAPTHTVTVPVICAIMSLCNMLILLLEPSSAITISGLPSPSRSPIACPCAADAIG